MPGVEVSDDAVALERIGLETFEEEFAAMDGYVLVPKGSGRPTGLDGISQAWLIHRGHAAGEGYIGGFVGSNGDGFAVEDTGRGRLGRRLTVALHETRIAGKRDRCTGITFGDVDLEEAEGGTAILEVEHQRCLFGVWGCALVWGLGCALFEGLQLFQGIVEDEDVVGHIRRDPHERISMDSLQ